MTRCPFCAEEIQAAAVFCKHCKRDVPPTASPLDQPQTAPPVPAADVVRGNTSNRSFFARGNTAKAALGLTAAGLLLSLFPGGIGIGFVLMFAGLFLLIQPSMLWRIATAGCGALLLTGPGAQIQAERAASRELAARQVELDGLPSQIQSSISRGDWERASAQIASLRRGRPNDPQMQVLNDQVEPEMRKSQTDLKRSQVAKAESARVDAVNNGLAQARAVLQESVQCETPKSIADAWGNLKLVRRADSQWAEAKTLAAGLESCRRKSAQIASAGLRDMMRSQRETWASEAELKMLDQGMDVRISLSGASKNTVTLKWALMGRPVVHKITNGGSMAEGAFLANLQKIGFRRVSFSDGFDFGQYYELEPDDESFGPKMLSGMGLGEPLVLR